jgi:hypothetical protein
VGAFESERFELDAWIDAHLSGPAYAERVRRVYMDLLRLGVSPMFPFARRPMILQRVTIKGPSGEDLPVYFREGQRRVSPLTDGTFCMTQAETGLSWLQIIGSEPRGSIKPVSREVLERATRVAKPWWLYRDHAAMNPRDFYDGRWPGFTLAPDLKATGGEFPREIRVCAEEADTGEAGTIYASGRKKDVFPPGRVFPAPADTPFATANAGRPIDCKSGTAFAYATDCGCGPGLERCMPSNAPMGDGRVLQFPTWLPLGPEIPFDEAPQGASNWFRQWLAGEAVHFFDYILAGDRDFRELLTARYSFVNGPLSQFYRSGMADGACCAEGVSFGYVEPASLVTPAQVPELPPQEVGRWQMVPDRGPQAAGILTMPAFLGKATSARSRARVLWQAFACRDFVAGKIELMPSSERDLTRRPGCQVCHATLEPLAAYFARIKAGSWTFLPPEPFPVHTQACRRDEKQPDKLVPASCNAFYDATFADAASATLRSAYAAPDHVEAGPAGLAEALTGSSEFAPCVARNMALSFLGRPLTADDAPLQAHLASAFTGSGYRMRALVRALVRSDAYQKANDLRSSVWRDRGVP